MLIENHFVDIAPHPVLARLERADHGMLGGVEMFGGVFVAGRVTAADVSASEAQAEMDPSVTGLETFLATARVRLDLVRRVQMSAGDHGTHSSLTGFCKKQ